MVMIDFYFLRAFVSMLSRQVLTFVAKQLKHHSASYIFFVIAFIYIFFDYLKV
jgi:hypothetical protein